MEGFVLWWTRQTKDRAQREALLERGLGGAQVKFAQGESPCQPPAHQVCIVFLEQPMSWSCVLFLS